MKVGWGQYLQTTHVWSCPGGPACFELISVRSLRDIQGQFVMRKRTKILLTHCQFCTRVYANLLFCTDRRCTWMKAQKEMSSNFVPAQQRFPLNIRSYQNQLLNIWSYQNQLLNIWSYQNQFLNFWPESRLRSEILRQGLKMRSALQEMKMTHIIQIWLYINMDLAKKLECTGIRSLPRLPAVQYRTSKNGGQQESCMFASSLGCIGVYSYT